MSDLEAYAIDAYGSFSTLMFDHQEIAAIAVTTVVALAASRFAYSQRQQWLKRTRRMFHIKRGKMMSKEDHMILQRFRAATIITDALEEAVIAGRLTQSYVNHCYKQLSHIFNDKNFRNRKNPNGKQPNKDELVNILRIVYGHKPIKTPGPKPGEVDNVHVYAKKEKRKFGDKARRNSGE